MIVANKKWSNVSSRRKSGTTSVGNFHFFFTLSYTSLLVQFQFFHLKVNWKWTESELKLRVKRKWKFLSEQVPDFRLDETLLHFLFATITQRQKDNEATTHSSKKSKV